MHFLLIAREVILRRTRTQHANKLWISLWKNYRTAALKNFLWECDQLINFLMNCQLMTSEGGGETRRNVTLAIALIRKTFRTTRCWWRRWWWHNLEFSFYLLSRSSLLLRPLLLSCRLDCITLAAKSRWWELSGGLRASDATGCLFNSRGKWEGPVKPLLLLLQILQCIECGRMVFNLNQNHWRRCLLLGTPAPRKNRNTQSASTTTWDAFSQSLLVSWWIIIASK